MEEKEEVKDLFEPCHVFGSDQILTDLTDIEYYKACLEEFEASNRLLGQIMHNGEYVISNEVKKDLARIPKELVSEDEEHIEAYCRVLAKDLFFDIQFENDGQQQIAQLYVIEKVSGYNDLSSIKTFVARVRQTEKDGFFELTKKAFNVNKVVDGINEGDFIDLVMQIQDLIDYSVALNEIDSLSSQIYVLSLTELLQDCGSDGQAILQRYNAQIKKLKLSKLGGSAKYIQMRKILDKIIDEFGGEKKIFAGKEASLKEIKKEYAAPIKKCESFKGKVAAKTVIKKQEKEAETPKPESKPQKAKAPKKAAGKSGGSKGGAKAKGKAKGKDKDKKKDEKKSHTVIMPRVAGKAPSVAPIVKEGSSAASPTPAAPKFPPLTRKAPKQKEEEVTNNLFSAILSRSIEENPTKEGQQLEVNEASGNVSVGVPMEIEHVSMKIEQIEIEL